MQEKKTIYVVYHNQCLDGFMSALLWHYGHGQQYSDDNNIIMVPSNYGDVIVPAKNGDLVVILDFSYPMELIRKFVKDGISVTMIDHHDSVIDGYTEELIKANGILFGGSRGRISFFGMVLPVVQESYCAISLADNRCCPINERKSAAGMVLDIYSESIRNRKEDLQLETLGELIFTTKLAERHDTWQHDGDRDDLASYLSAWFYHWIKQEIDTVQSLKAKPEESYAKFVELVDKFMAIPLLDKLSQGKRIVMDDFHDVVYMVSQHKRDCHYNATSSYVAIVTLPDNVRARNISMMGSYLCKEQGYDIALMIFRLENTDNYVVSMRSDQNKQNVDVSAIATLCKTLGIAFTGGGHRNAAGMTVHKDNLPKLFDLFVDLEKDV
jgi:oligoribonuclease NrnB/cAMP/cGMP phosphodiesterase (DHH superfamily)